VPLGRLVLRGGLPCIGHLEKPASSRTMERNTLIIIGPTLGCGREAVFFEAPTYPKTPKTDTRCSLQPDDPRVLRGLSRGVARHRSRPLQPQACRLARPLQPRTPAPHLRPAIPAILPPGTTTQVPKVLDSYNYLTFI